MFYESSNGHGLKYSPLKAIVAPRPIGWISTCDQNGAPNLAPYSYFNAVNDIPPLLMFSSHGVKHSAANAIETGEFVVNLATRKLADAMVKTSSPESQGVSEFDIAGLESAPSELVRPPRVKDTAAALECRTTQHFHPVDTKGNEAPSIMIVGEVVGVYIADEYITDGRFDVAKAGTISRLGYRDYAQVEELFEIERPSADPSLR